MAGKSVIIIGAGLAGLSTGYYCQTNGYSTRIFEHHNMPGGVAATWKRKDYLIDGGVHFFMGYKPGQGIYDLYRELGINQDNRFKDMTVYGRFVDETSGRSITVTRDLDKFAAELKSSSPADSGEVDQLLAAVNAMQGLDLGTMGFSKPPELIGRLDSLKQFWVLRRVFKYFTGKYAEPVEKYVQSFQDPWLRQVIRNIFLPEVPAWFVIMLLKLLADGQMGLAVGGSQHFAQSIEKRYKDLGGQAIYEATVEKILVEKDKAVGIRLADGSEHRADIVVSAADGYSTIFEMLGGRYVNEKIKDRYANWQLCRPLFMINYGVSRDLQEEPPFSTILLKHPLKVAGHEVEGILIRIFNYSSEFAPSGRTVVQVSFETEWDYWNGLHREDRARYNAEKKRIAEDVIKSLEVHYLGISAQVEMIDVATPYSTWRYTRNREGAYEGWMLTPQAIMTLVERTLPGLENFYMSGQWVIPGGSVPGCLYSGRHVAQILCHREGKKFHTAL